MRRTRWVTGGASLLGLVAVAVLVSHFFNTSRQQNVAGSAENRVPQLKTLVERQEKESAEAVASYAPEVKAPLDDLTAPAEPVLRRLPGVARVEVAVRAEKPIHRIVHLRDWHFVPKDLYAIDVMNAAGRPLSDEEIDRLHEELCLEVEAVQLEQMAPLRCLVKHHGLKRLYCEGLTEKDVPNYTSRGQE